MEVEVEDEGVYSCVITLTASVPLSELQAITGPRRSSKLPEGGQGKCADGTVIIYPSGDYVWTETMLRIVEPPT